MLEWFSAFSENSHNAMVVVDREGGIVTANPAFVHLTNGHGKDPAESLAGCNLPQEIMAELSSAVHSVAAEGTEKSLFCETGEGDLIRKFSCRVLPCPGGKLGEIIIEIRDESLTQRLQHELQARRLSRRQEELLLERRKQLFFGLLDELPTFVYLQRRDYTVAFANKKVRKLFGDPSGRLCYEVFGGRTSPCPTCPTFDVFETGCSVEWEFSDNDGRTFIIYDYPYEDETGESLVLEMGVDITELKRVEKELFKAQKLKAIGVLAGGIAHDLNNNLVPIIFNIEYALGKLSDWHMQEPLEEALQAAQRAASLVAQVLEYSRQQDVTRKSMPLTPVIDKCLKDFLTIQPAGVSLQVDYGAEPDIVTANGAQMQQVVMNILRNAAQAMPEGGSVSVSTWIETLKEQGETGSRSLKPGKYVAFAVSDTGVGIKPEVQEQIFEPFFTSRKGRGGTGMGLAVVHSIVTGSGGDILVHSTPGIGTTFTVYLPAGRQEIEMLQGELNYLSGEDTRLLLVDDDPGTLSAMARSLRNAGFHVDTAGCGEEGLEKFRSSPDGYGLVLADQSMPDMMGLEMAEKMLAHDRDARILICTGHIEPALEVQAKKEGIAGFARKPMSPKALVETVKRHCRYR